MSKKYVYMFAEGNANMRELLGGKGANLAEMASLGLPVPYGFTITTEACNAYYDDGKKINKDIMSQVKTALAKLEKQAGKIIIVTLIFDSTTIGRLCPKSAVAYYMRMTEQSQFKR